MHEDDKKFHQTPGVLWKTGENHRWFVQTSRWTRRAKNRRQRVWNPISNNPRFDHIDGKNYRIFTFELAAFFQEGTTAYFLVLLSLGERTEYPVKTSMIAREFTS